MAMVTVSILTDSRERACSAGCGTDWSLPDSREAAAREFQSRFASQAYLSFFDLAGEELPGPATELAEKVRSRGLALPVLAIDGEPRIAGYFDLRMACDMVEASMEMKDGR